MLPSTRQAIRQELRENIARGMHREFDAILDALARPCATAEGGSVGEWRRLHAHIDRYNHHAEEDQLDPDDEEDVAVAVTCLLDQGLITVERVVRYRQALADVASLARQLRAIASKPPEPGERKQILERDLAQTIAAALTERGYQVVKAPEQRGLGVRFGVRDDPAGDDFAVDVCWLIDGYDGLLDEAAGR